MNKSSKAYNAGFSAKKEEIKLMGFEAARDKFNLENPIGCKHETLEAYEYAEGEMDALMQSLGY